jgi:hypothetical protein
MSQALRSEDEGATLILNPFQPLAVHNAVEGSVVQVSLTPGQESQVRTVTQESLTI